MINIVLLGVPEKSSERDEKYTLHRMISVLLSPDLTTEERMEILENEYQLKDDKELREELNDMCNLSEGIYEKGMREGKREGAHEANVETAKRMLADGVDDQTVVKYTGLSAKEVETLANLQLA